MHRFKRSLQAKTMSKAIDKGINKLLGVSKRKQKSGENARNSGYKVESAALRFLVEQQVDIIATNHHCRRGEVDIVGQCNGHLLFIEVRFRSNIRYASAAESVDYRKQQKVIIAAQDFLMHHPQYTNLPARFDVITASAIDGGGQLNFEWIQDAFQVN